MRNGTSPRSPASRETILECGGLPPLWPRQEPSPPKTGCRGVRPVRRDQSGGKPPHSIIARSDAMFAVAEYPGISPADVHAAMACRFGGWLGHSAAVPQQSALRSATLCPSQPRGMRRSSEPSRDRVTWLGTELGHRHAMPQPPVVPPQLRPWQELVPYRRCAPAADSEMFTLPTEWGEENAKWGFSCGMPHGERKSRCH
jgi:hypothetical protein